MASAARSRTIPVGECGTCDTCGRLTIGGVCRQCFNELWGDPNGVEQARVKERRTRRQHDRYLEFQERVRVSRREQQLEKRLDVNGVGCNQRAIRKEIVHRQARQPTFTLGCDEVDLGKPARAMTQARQSVEGRWLEQVDTAKARRHLNKYEDASGQHCPGLDGAKVWAVPGFCWDTSTANNTYGVKRSAGRAEKALRWAQKNAEIGNRNALGYWLCRRCRSAGLSEGETEQIIERWWTKVPQGPGRGAYTLGEAMATLRSAMRLYDPAKDLQRDAA